MMQSQQSEASQCTTAAGPPDPAHGSETKGWTSQARADNQEDLTRNTHNFVCAIGQSYIFVGGVQGRYKKA
jgi:hypothetical protein